MFQPRSQTAMACASGVISVRSHPHFQTPPSISPTHRPGAFADRKVEVADLIGMAAVRDLRRRRETVGRHWSGEQMTATRERLEQRIDVVDRVVVVRGDTEILVAQRQTKSSSASEATMPARRPGGRSPSGRPREINGCVDGVDEIENQDQPGLQAVAVLPRSRERPSPRLAEPRDAPRRCSARAACLRRTGARSRAAT